ncbi:sigma-70 factor domain-containing protein, partial [Burkholderia multivorans]|uniref:sigma-70 factor domain-containing protein n=1 Tax=Burkholderia multivorans TaxID=87883 RepID=UPI0028707F71
MPKSKRQAPQADSEKISRATQASVERSGASTDDEDDVADNERDFEARDADTEGGDDEREGRAEAAPDVDDFRALLQAELTADTIQHYLNRISVKPLLTVEEEQCYSRLAKAGEFEARQVM